MQLLQGRVDCDSSRASEYDLDMLEQSRPEYCQESEYGSECAEDYLVRSPKSRQKKLWMWIETIRKTTVVYVSDPYAEIYSDGNTDEVMKELKNFRNVMSFRFVSHIWFGKLRGDRMGKRTLSVV